MQDDLYFVSEVMTASPQNLRLMLIEGALQHARRAVELWQERKLFEAGDSIDRMRAIVTELMTRMNRERQPELTDRVVSLYTWMYGEIAQAHIGHDAARLQKVIDVLEIERGTWQQVCELLPGPVPVPDGFPPETSTANPPALAAPLAPPDEDDPLADVWNQQANLGMSFDG